MSAKKSAPPKDAAAKHFPIFSYEDYDFTFHKSAWPIGLKSTYPEELVRRVGAAMISLQMGNSAIDYTYKKYLKDHTYEMDDGSRLDLRLSREIKKKTSLLSALISEVTGLGPKKDGQFICEWTFLRIPFSINFLLSCANRGAFFESAAIARMALEQIGWANSVDPLEDFESVQKTSATKSIGALKDRFGGAGRLYGWLSVHTHWAYEGHVKAMHLEDGVTSSLFATSKFKACSLVLTALILVLAVKVFSSIRSSEIEIVLNGPEKAFDIAAVLDGKLAPKKAELKLLTELSSLSSLANEVASHYPEDEDILDLSEELIRECTEGNDHG
jgi:hypothetical protein